MEPFQLIEKVNSFETFLEFLHSLMFDKYDEDEKEKVEPSLPYSEGHNGWASNDIASYLEAMYAAADGHDYPEIPSWRDFAKILYLGKIYE